MLRDLDKQTYTEYEAMNVAPSQPTQTPSLSTTSAVETIKPFYLFPKTVFRWMPGRVGSIRLTCQLWLRKYYYKGLIFLFYGSRQIFKTHTKTTFSQVTSERDFPIGSVRQFHTRNSKSYVRIFTIDAQNGCHETSVTLHRKVLTYINKQDDI
jgi:ribulose bisphosphate carboxylase small subunit